MIHRIFNQISKQNIYRLANAKHNDSDFVYGVNPVEAAFHARRRELYTLYLSDSAHIELSSRTAQLMKISRQRGVPVVFTHKDKLSRMVKQQPHQNIVLQCSHLPLPPWNPSMISQKGVYVYCDKITDPQNFGAIIRSSLFFGVKAILTGKKNHCPLNSTVSKTSSGAAQLLPTYLVDKSGPFLESWKQTRGVVVATSVEESKPHTSADRLAELLRIQKVDKVLLVLGSEGKGVSPHLVATSDFRVAIERTGLNEHPFTLIDSLNVSAALSVLLFELTRK